MKVMVLGTKKIAFVNKEGEEIRGLKLFYGWENPEDPNLSGMETADCFLTEAKTPKKDLDVGTEATIYYNRFGSLLKMSYMQGCANLCKVMTLLGIYSQQ